MFSNVRGGAFKLNDGKFMPFVGLGTYALFNQNEIDTAVDAALKEGYRLFDTAKFYRNESELGFAFKVCYNKNKKSHFILEVFAKIQFGAQRHFY
jgi:diketogulonate reductase-like aldo/keto reductase